MREIQSQSLRGVMNLLTKWPIRLMVKALSLQGRDVGSIPSLATSAVGASGENPDDSKHRGA